MIVAFDDNLGLPGDFTDRVGCELASYHELADMLRAFEQGAVHAMFAPAGSLPYLHAEPVIVAQATRGPERTHRLRSTHRVSKGGPPPSFDDVATSRIGCVNLYCTTSFWAPMISLIENRPDAADAESIEFVTCAGFVDMFASVVDGRSDGAMVWEAVAAANPDLVAETIEVFDSVDLAAPVIVVNDTLDADGRAQLTRDLADFESADDTGFFNGFSTPDRDLVAAFEREMAAAKRHFGIDTTY